MKTLIGEFVSSPDTLRVYQGKEMLFNSDRDRLSPLLEYIDRLAPYHRGVTVFDKIVGNAAALLLVKAACRRVYSPLGSEVATRTLSSHGIEYHFSKTVPRIQNVSREDICPLEKLSLNKSPEEFYRMVGHYH
jgi:hypothetical protein